MSKRSLLNTENSQATDDWTDSAVCDLTSVFQIGTAMNEIQLFLELPATAQTAAVCFAL